MTSQGMKPARIRIQMVNTFRLSSIELPTLRQVNELVYRPTSDEIEPFVFGFKHDAIGRPRVGRGSDEDPFLLGVTSKRLLRQMDAPTDTFVFHVDATFKLSTLGYPVLVCGVSDQNRRFPLVALFIMSQRMVGKAIAIRYVMGDAEHAQYAAVEASFGNTEYLMCFYHLIANVQEHLRGVSNESCIEVLRAIYAMHYSSSVDEFYAIVQESFHSWSRRPDLLGFAQYFNNQWLLGRFRVWQCFARPAGYATTNNPAEQFNKVLKRDYSRRARLKLGTLVKLIASCVRASSGDTSGARRSLSRHFRGGNVVIHDEANETQRFQRFVDSYVAAHVGPGLFINRCAEYTFYFYVSSLNILT
ncbi:TPA: hypothetical protein N0F65_008442 [Lagenidium giganteum]|uniref:MULE transposase domain-containing protein n=1 Tax=Lagenidium giganteum TaxID=4803 RepID=A0AAV2YRA1_9STRA|nr:TPA: hypothetical protein N0F65_008442 [Lagenidium giganteum]